MRFLSRAVLVCGILMPAVFSHAANQNNQSETAFTWHAKWIAAPWSTEHDGAEADGSRPMPIFRREFVVKQKPTKAELRIVGLGQWQATLGNTNGVRPVEPPGLHGAWTDYRKTVAYDEIDVTPMIEKGRDVLAVMLGNGMYNVQ